MKAKMIATVILLSAVLLLCCIASSAKNTFEVVFSRDDGYVYAPGMYDFAVGTDAEEPTYQWYARVGPGGDNWYVELEDNENYFGTKTAHLQMTTTDGLEYGSGWESIYFSCLVTDKNGVSIHGPERNMQIYTHEALLKRLEKDGAGITSMSVSYTSGGKPDFIEEKDGVVYYNSFGDKMLQGTPYTSPLDPELQMRSEVELRTESYVIYDGKTIPLSRESKGFKPQKYGQGMLIFREDLVLYVNGDRMETIDSKNAVVNVCVPAGIGYAATKKETPLREQQYSQSQVLCYIPKDTYVTIIEESGIFYKVAGHGWFGYVAKEALNVGDSITNVSLTIKEPSDYADFDTSPVLFDKDSYELYKTDPVTWYDKTSGKFLTEGDTFRAGHTYVLSVWLSAKPGKQFPLLNNKPDVVAEINGIRVTAGVAYEQDPQDVIALEYTYTHVHDTVKVNQKYPTCTSAGKSLYYHCDCGADFEDYRGQNRITDGNWGIIPPLGHRESSWHSDGTNHYKVCLRRECGEIISDTAGVHTGGTATCTRGAICTVCGLEYGAKAAHTWATDRFYSDETGHARYCTGLCGTISSIEAHVPGPSATETDPCLCTVCGYVIEPTVNHVHDMVKKEAMPAGCTTPGNIEYYYCNTCNRRFSDAEGKNELRLEETVIYELGHDYPETWSFDEDFHRKNCKRCGVEIPDTAGTHAFGDGDVCTVCGYKKGDVIPEATETPMPSTETPSSSPEAGTPSPGGNVKEPKSGISPLIIALIVIGVFLVCACTALIIVLVVKKKKS